MNKRQVIILCSIAIILAALVAIVKITSRDDGQAATTRAAGQTLFETFPATDVAAIAITGAEGVVTIERKDRGWKLAERDGFPANPTYVNDLIRTIADLKVTRGMEAGPSFAPRFGMDQNATDAEDRGLTAVFKDVTGKEIATVSLGKNIESGADPGPFGGAAVVGRYIRNHADESGFYAVNEMFPAVSDDASRWLQDGFFSPEKIQSITLHGTGGDGVAWKVTRENEEAEFKLADAIGNEVLDSSAASPFKNLFSFARFNDVVPAAEVEEKAGTDPTREAVIETFEGFTYRLTITPQKTAEDADDDTVNDVLLTVAVDAELPEVRKKEEDEIEEDAKIMDEAFTERLATLKEKLERESALADYTFLVSKNTVDPLLKKRDEITTKAEPVAETAPQPVPQAPGGGVTTPPRTVTSPPIEAVTPPIEAVTPPIAVPPFEIPEDDADEGYPRIPGDFRGVPPLETPEDDADPADSDEDAEE